MLGKKCPHATKIKAFVLPYIIDTQGNLQILMGVRQEKLKHTNSVIPYIFHFFGGTCERGDLGKAMKSCAIRELCEESLEFLQFDEADLIKLGKYRSIDSETINAKCTDFYLFGLALDMDPLEIRKINSNKQKVGMPCFENDFLDFVTEKKFKSLLQNQFIYHKDFKDQSYRWRDKFSKDWNKQHNIYLRRLMDNSDQTKSGISKRFADLVEKMEQTHMVSGGLVQFLKNHYHSKKQQHSYVNVMQLINNHPKKRICNCMKSHQSLYKKAMTQIAKK